MTFFFENLMQNGRLKQVIYILACFCLFGANSITAQNIYTSTDTPITIPNDQVVTITSTITVTDDLCIEDVNVLNLSVTHSWVSDLQVFLTSPNGTTVSLINQVCGSQNDIDLNFDDSGAAYSSIPCPPTNGLTYHPEGDLASFVGENTNGTWTLTVVDNFAWDGGALESWQLEIFAGLCNEPSGACDSDTPFHPADLSAAPDATYISPADQRDGNCCDNPNTSPPSRCIEFEVLLHPDAVGLEFGIESGAVPSGSMYYQVDCGDEIPVGESICLTGTGPFTITFCKPGNNTNEYYINSIPSGVEAFPASAYEGCPETLSVIGFEEATIVWNDITSGTGAYDSNLSCTTACANPVFTITDPNVSTIQYEVCGEISQTVCDDDAIIVCDTVTVDITQAFDIIVNPYPVSFCQGSSDTPEVLASTTTSGNFSFTWYDGPNGTGNVVSNTSSFEPSTGGDYSIVIYETSHGACSERMLNVNVQILNCQEDCDNEIDDDFDGLIDAFDDDCPCDDDGVLAGCQPDCEYIPPTLPNFTVEEEWTSAVNVNTLVPTVAGELDGDLSATEIIALGDQFGSTLYEGAVNNILIIDGGTGELKYRPNTLPVSQNTKGMAIADADRDGNGEFYYIVSNDTAAYARHIVCYEYDPTGINPEGSGTGTFTRRWISDQAVDCNLGSTYEFYTQDFSVALADFNFDGTPEVYVGNEIYNALTGEKITDGGSNSIGSSISDYSDHFHFHAYPVAVDVLPDYLCDDCAGLELVAGNQVYAVDIANGTMTVERQVENNLPDGMTSIVDYDLDGDLDAAITMTTTTGSYLYIWDLQSNLQIGATHTITEVVNPWYRSVSNAVIADFDGDNLPEIGVCGNYVFQVIDDHTQDISGTGGVLWSITTTDNSGMTGAAAFDFNGDGITEVVYRDENDLRIISGPTGINLATYSCGSVTGTEYPVVIDIDYDGETEVICNCGDATYSSIGTMRAFKSDTYPWVPTRSVWNQYGYFVTNINDNLSIPIEQQPHHKVGNPTIGVSGRLNTFLKQVGPTNDLGEPLFPASNLQTTILSNAELDDCGNLDSLEITLRFANYGDVAFPGGTSFAIYNGNPEVAATLVGVYSVEVNVPVNDSIIQTVYVDISSLSFPVNLYIVGNDDGSLTIPFDLENDFPTTPVGECDFENNMDFISLDYCDLINDTEGPIITLNEANDSGDTTLVSNYPDDQRYFVFENGNWAQADIASDVTNSWTTVTFNEPFNAIPTLLTQIITDNDSDALVARVRNLDETGFQVRLRNQESNGGTISAESVAWIAMDQGGSSANVTMEALSTGNSVDENWYEVTFLETYSGTPIFIGSCTSRTGGDPISIRYRNLTATNVELLAQEEQSDDNEIGHSNEEVSYVVFDSPGLIQDTFNSNFAEVGRIQIDHDNNEDDWTKVNLLKTYENPVVVAGPVGFDDSTPTTLRVRNVDTTSFEIQIDNWDYLGRAHGTETIHYMVMELKPQAIVEASVDASDTEDDVTDCDEQPTAPIASVTDNCDDDVEIVFNETVNISGCDKSVTWTWTATDDCGNVTVETQVLDFSDANPPVITNVPADVTVNCNGEIPDDLEFDCTTILENVALNKTVSQSSTSHNGLATRAVDGNTSGNWGNGSVTHTSSEANAWWEVDLHEVTDIDSIEIWGRTDCCSDRLSDYYVFVSDDPFTSTDLNTTLNQSGVTAFYFNTTAGTPTGISLDQTGRYVRVQLNETNPLSLAEVVVYSEIATGVCATDDCDDDLSLDFTETSTQTSDGSCTDQNYIITRTWTATDDCGNIVTGQQTITVLCECCGNGIDDDQDGLPDDIDPDCNCAEVDLTSCDSLLYYYIPPVWQLNGSTYNNDPNLIITTAFSEANVNIYTADGTTFNQSFNLGTGNPATISLSTDELQTPNHNSVENDRGFIVESDREIDILYRMNAYNNQFLASIKGKEALGYSFRAGSQTKTCGSPNTSRRENHFISVMATEDNTLLTFDFATTMAGGIASPHAITLNRGETYLIRDNNTNVTVSGISVVADKPVSVMSGSQHTNICNSILGDSGLDHLVPVCNVGTDYAVVRGDGNSNQNYALVVATEDNTNVYINGGATSIATLNAGDYYEYDLGGSLGDATYIQTSSPAYLYQFSGLSTVNPEVGMTLLPPLTSCNGERQLEFIRFDGADLQLLQLIVDDNALPSLTINGAPYTDYTSAVAISGLSGYSLVSIEDGLIDLYNSIEAADGYFHANLVTGITNTSGTFSAISGFSDNLDVYDPVEDLPTSYYFADSICVGTVYAHCLKVESCTDNNSIVSFDHDTDLGTIDLTSDLCFDYTPEPTAIGTDVITFLVQNEFGKQTTVCVEIFICNGVQQLTVVSIPDTITIDCSDPIDVPVTPIIAEGCVEIDFTETLTAGSAGCADNSYVLERKWVARGFCGTDSLSLTQVVNVIDNTPPVIFNVPDDIDLQCMDCLQSFLNGDFEEPGFSGAWQSIHEDNVPGWSTTASDNRIEIQRSGQINGVVSYSGNYHAELNGNLNGDFYQEFCTVPTTTLQVSFAHHKRVSGNNTTDDIMAVYAGPDINNLSFIESFTATNTSGWTVHTLSYFVPAGQSNTVIAFRAIQGAPSNITFGNLIDDVNVITLLDNVLIPDATDNCDDDVELILSETQIDGNCENHFQLIRTWTAVDNCGNASVATQTLSVGDFEPPVFANVPADITVDCDNIPVASNAITASDNCTLEADVIFDVNDVSGAGCNYQIVRTWTATDVCGNSADTFQLITVIDDTAPEVNNVPADITIFCGDTVPDVIYPAVTDACFTSVDTIYLEDIQDAGCDGGSEIERTWTFRDACGNETTVSQNITVRDTTAPVFTTFPDDVTFDCSETVSITEPTASDACSSSVTITYSDTNGIPPCEESYTIIRTWIATDDCGNIATREQTIAVQDNTPPVFSDLPADITVECDDFPITDAPSVTDDCSDFEVTLDELKQSIICEDSYEVRRTWTAIDACGNRNQYIQIVTVIDTISPAIITAAPADVTISCEDAIPAVVDPDFQDNCANLLDISYRETVQDSICEGTYTIVREWIAIDSCDNMTIENQMVFVIDNIAPLIASVNDLTINCDDLGSSQITDWLNNVTATDNCSSVDITNDYDPNGFSGGCSATTGTQTVTFTASDACGNDTQTTAVITIIDNTAPVFDPIANITLSCTASTDTITTWLNNISATDNCGNITITNNYDPDGFSGGCSTSTGTQTVTFTATDECGNVSQENGTITLLDDIAPVLDPVDDLILTCDTPMDTITSWLNGATATDDCSNITITNNYDPDGFSGGCSTNTGTQTVTFTVMDECGNTSNLDANIIILDDEPPVFNNPPADITVECGMIPDPGTITASDDCGGTVTVTHTDQSISGENIINHESGSLDDFINTTPEYFNLNLSGYDDLTANDIHDFTINFRSQRGKGRIEFVLIAPSGDAITLVGEHCNTGDCVDGDFGFETYGPTFYHCGSGFDQWDNSNSIPTGDGNFEPNATTVTGYTGITQFVTCFDELTGPMNGTWTLAALKAGSGQVLLNDFSMNVNNSACLEELGITRTFTATDECGNITTHIQTITIEDTTGPVFDSNPVDLADINCHDSFPVQEILTASDCGGDVIVTPSIDPYTVDICNGYIVTYRWSAVDDCGNTSEVTSSFNVLPDDTPPTFNETPDPLADISCGETLPEQQTLTATDNCSTADVVASVDSYVADDCNGYEITYRWTTTDACGNTDEITQTFNVLPDLSPPSLVNVPGDTIVNCGEIPDTISIIANDNCSNLVNIVFNEAITNGTCDEEYIITRTWTGTDACGNITTENQVITVQDNDLPSLVGIPNDTIVNCGAIPDTSLWSITAFDNCDSDVDITFSEVQTDGACTGEYTLTRTWIATDNCGNQSQGVQIIMVQDTIVPVFDNQPIDITVDCNDIPVPPIVTATDNCGSTVGIAYNEESFAGECVDLYNIHRTWIATDVCGNTDTVTQIVSVTGCGPGIEVSASPDSTLCDGGDITLTVSMTTGYQTPNFLWQYSSDGTAWADIPNSNNSTYTFTVDASSQGFYHVIVSNSPDNFDNPACSVTSNDINLTVLPVSPDTDLVEELCQGESFTVGSQIFNTTGNYTVTLQNEFGCDSIVNLDLTVHQVYTIDLSESICEGETYTVGTSTYTTSGTYTDVLPTVAGCDSTINLTLTVNPVYDQDIVEVICEGDSIVVGTSVYTTTGIYTDVLTTINGCDSIVNLDLTVNPVYSEDREVEICQGESYTVGTSTYNTTGIYTDVLPTEHGCDSVINLILTVNPTYTVPINATICEGESYTVGTSTYTTSGMYTDVLPTVAGCDSTINLTLTVNPVYDQDIEEVICEGDSIVVGTSTYTTTGMYTDVLTTINGCDSIVNLDLTVNPVYSEDREVAICQGESYTVGTSTYTTSGMYTDVLSTEHDCDSVINLTLTVNPTYTVPINATICEGESYTVGTSTYTTSGTYTDVLSTVAGCDSTINLTLTVNPVYDQDIVEVICEGESIVVGTSVYTTTGSYTDVLTTIAGCDSIVNLDLTVNPVYSENREVEICQGESYTVGTSTYSTAGIYTDVLSTEHGCDSVINLTLTVNPTYTLPLSATICEGETYTVGTSTYTTSGTYTDVLPTVAGCDSTINLTLTVNPVYDQDIVEVICEGDSIVVGTSVYTTTGSYTDVLTTINGCDSIVNLDLTVNPVYSEDREIAICQGESYTVGTSTYTTAGIYTDVLPTEHGCDSVINLTLTVNPTYTFPLSATICEGETYTVGTSTYTTSGIYTDVLPTVAGCDSTINLTLTVNPVYDQDIVEVICEGDSIMVGTSVYTMTGSYTDVLTTINGCDSIVNLDLTVNPVYSEDREVAICQGESYTVGTSTYTTSGMYTDVLSTEHGCDSVINLTLTVNPTYTLPLSATICEGETYTVGTSTYTTSGIYTDVLPTVAGCDSTINLTLTVNPVYDQDIVEVICEGDSIVVGTSTYTTTGMYTDVLTTVNGCDSIVNLDLTVNPVYSENREVAICQGESYTVGTSTYSTAGIYTDVLSTEHGCDSVINLTLIVNPTYTVPLSATICEGETYTVGTSTYTTSGTYTDVLPTAAGCDSTINLTLTVNPVYDQDIVEVICEGDSIVVGTSTYATTGMYTDVLTTVNGCDSIVNLDLTVIEPINITLDVDLCEGEDHNGITYTASTSFNDTYTSIAGCDSIVTTNIIVHSHYDETVMVDLCEGGVYQGIIYTADTVLVENLNSEFGCDSIVTTIIAVTAEVNEILNVNVCNGDIYDGVVYTSNTVLTDTYTATGGCDSIVTTNIFVIDPVVQNITEVICEGDSIIVGTSVYRTTGTYTDVLTTTLGCDSTVNLNLTVNPVYSEDREVAICQGESYTVGTSTYNTAGVYTDVLSTEHGCDSVINLTLTVNPTYTLPLSATICEGETYTVGTSTYTTSGIYTDVLTTVAGCDSTINLTLTVNPVYDQDIEEVICEGDSVVVGTSVYTTTGTYTDVLSTVNGCDSILNLDLTVNPVYSEDREVAICQGESYTVGTSTYNTAGVYTDVLSTEHGCDSVINLTLAVNPTYTLPLSATICEGETYTVGTSTYTTSGMYTDVLPTVAGCDSTINLTLTVNPVYDQDIVEVICEGDSIVVGTSAYTTTGSYTDVLTTINGCDSIVNLDLTVLQPITNDLNIDLCEGDTYNGIVYSVDTSFTNTYIAANSCDSIVTTNVNVHLHYNELVEINLCEGAMYNGEVYITDTTLVENLTTAYGCDSIITTEILVTSGINEVLNVNLCYGEAYEGTNYTADATFVNTYTATGGCDSTVTTNIFVQEEIVEDIAHTICEGESITVGTNTYTTAGTYTDILTSSTGCDSTVNLTLLVNQTYTIDLTESICQGENYTVGTSTYTISGNYTDTLATINGCDSIVNLVLTVNPSYTIPFEATICEGETFTVGSSSYSTAGTYTDVLTTVDGCDSTIILTLTVNPVYDQNLAEVICEGESYTVGANVYNATGLYTEVLTTVEGCDSTINLDLTVLAPLTNILDVNLCEGELYNGIPYTTDATVQDTYTAANGCDSIVTANITVHNPYDELVEVNLCEGAMYNGVVYTADATLVDNLTSEFGCDSTITTQIMVTSAITENIDVALCYGESYDGTPYTTSTVLVNTYTSSGGCDSTVTTNITVFDEMLLNIDSTICTGGSVTIGTNVYTTPGNYTNVLVAANGCDSTITLNLLVNDTYEIDLVETICQGESITIGSDVYNTTGTYSSTLTASNGCDSIVNLDLTVNQAFTINFNESICQGEELVVGAETYNTAGTYTQTLSTSIGCDSIIIVNLTVNDVHTTDLLEEICQGESITIGTNVYTTSGSYTDVLTSYEGCDSTVNLQLTVNQPTSSITNVDLCSGEEYDGIAYTADATLTEVLTGINNCDSIAMTNIIVHPHHAETVAVNLCEGGIYNGVIYNTDATLVDNFTSVYGCDSIITTEITVTPLITDTIDIELCYGASYNGTIYTADAVWTNSYTAVSGCDSIVTTQVFVEDELITDIVEIICEGESVVVGTSTYTTSGNYTDILTTASGCDSTVNLALTVNPVYTEDIVAEICEGETYTVGSSIYNSSGIYTDVLTTVNGCDSTINLTLTVNPVYTEDIVAEICEGETYTVGSSIYNSSGIYTDVLTTVNGCDSTINLTLTVNPVYDIDFTAVICQGESVAIGSNVYTTTGNYTDVLVSSTGCDSIINLALQVNQPTSSETTVELCTGEMYEGTVYTGDETLVETLTGINGCDSIATTFVIVHPDFAETIPVNICEGEEYDGISYFDDAVLVDSFTTVQGCDSIITTNINVIPTLRDTQMIELCFGGVYDMTPYFSDTILIDTFPAISGCDSIVVRNINVEQDLITNLNETICEGESVIVGTNVYTTSGNYTDILPSNSGCDSTVNLILIVNQPTSSENDITLCAGDFHNGTAYFSDTVLVETLTGINDCDSVATTNIFVNPEYSELIEASICEGDLYDGVLYLADTILVDNYLTVNGCDSIITTTLDILPIQYDTSFINLCYGDFYNGTIYLMDDIYTDTYTAATGCDSLHTTVIAVSNGVMTNLNEIICQGESIHVGTNVYTTNGVFADTLIGSNGCDSIVNLILTVNDTFNIDIAGVICEGEQFDVGGFSFSDGGEHTVVLSTVNGCDSTVNLSLTVNPVYLDTIFQEICDGESFAVGTNTYTETGVYTEALSTAAGCDSTIVLDLTVHPVYDLFTEAQICIGDEYQQGNSIYTESGVYTDTLTTGNGCDSILTVDLTVIPIYYSTVHANICEGNSYYAGGADQTAEGTYYDTIVNNVGCNNVLITHLFILENYEETYDVSICEGETYYAGGQLQLASGTYYDTLIASTGCDSMVVTNLTVNPIYQDTLQIGICEGESYYAAGAEQTTPGTYISNYQTINGCDSTVVVELEVNVNKNISFPVTMCEGESITVNGVEQTETGVYVDSLSTSVGCDSFVTYLVTVIDRYETFFDEVICEGDSILIAGEYRSEAGEFVEELTSQNGCDSIIVTELIVEPVAQLLVNDMEMCFGEEVQLSVEGSDQLSWSPADGLSCTDCPNPIADPRVTTTYTVSTESCMGTMVEASVTVTVHNPPSLTVSTDNNVILNDGIVLTAISTDPDALITWYQNGEIVCEDCTEYTAEPSVNMSFLVVVEDEYGCTNSDNVDVNVNDACSFSNFEIPNIISPNGDGYNDEFEIKYEGVEEVSLLRIYNRWGEMVFETYDIDQRWDGTFKGKRTNPGVYIYYMEGRCLDNEPFTKTGNITVLK